LAGAEAIVAAGKHLRPATVIGVQSADLPSALKYARHARKIGADGIISLPPIEKNSASVLEYYREIGKATDLPLFVQSTGDMSVELIVRMCRAIPTLSYVKDEAGRSPLARIGQLKDQSGDRLKVFTGNHGSTLIDEMQRGSSGSMPAAAFADLYVPVWELWQKGRHNEAMDLFGKVLLFIPEVQAYGIQSLKYLLYLRGVFPAYGVRAKDAAVPLDESGKRVLGEMLQFVKPWLKA
jgi:4-hydroxy-tetrahydrodipicolinate synthase